MGDFVAYYWSVDDVPLAYREAVNDVISPASREALLASFNRLLESGDSATCGVALDQFVYGEAIGRFGTRNPFAAFGERILEVARGELGRPAVGNNESSDSCYGANHASALGALGHLGTAADLARLRKFLVPELDVRVFSAATMAVSQCIEGAEQQEIDDVAERLLAIAQDQCLPEHVRDMAIAPIRMSAALVKVAPLLEVARGDCLPLAIQAAWALAGRADLDDELRRMVSLWPEDAPYPASEVRELLGTD